MYHLSHTPSLCWLEKYYFINYSICLLEYNRKFLNCPTFLLLLESIQWNIYAYWSELVTKLAVSLNFEMDPNVDNTYSVHILCLLFKYCRLLLSSDSQHDRFNSHRHQLLVMLSNKAEQTLLKVLSLLPVLVMDYAILFKLLHSLAVKPEDTTLKYFKFAKDTNM